MLANLLIHWTIVKMTAENFAQNVTKVLGKMKRLWQNVRPTWYYWNLEKRRMYEFLRKRKPNGD